MAGSFRDLTVFKKAFALAMDIFNITKKFLSEEKFELTDQIRRSSVLFVGQLERGIGNGNIQNIFQVK